MEEAFNKYSNLEMKLIISSISEIENKYYLEEITKLQNDKVVATGEFRANENSYVSQLAGNIESAFKQHSIHLDKHYQMDIAKQIILSDWKKYEATFQSLFGYGAPEDEEFYKRPDIVIHAGPNDFIADNQIFIAEVKTSLNLTQKLFDIDLFKINVYHEKLKFKNSAFIIINTSVEEVRMRLEIYKKNRYFQSKRAGIKLIVKPSYKEKLELIRL